MPEPRRARSQGGSIVVTAVLLCAVLAILVTVSLSLANSASSGSGHDARAAVALQTADAGVSRYLARLAADSAYATKYVDPAEDPRIPTAGGAAVQPGHAWPGGAWTYAAGPPVTHTALGSSAARFGSTDYSLRIYPDAGSANSVVVQSVGRVGANTPHPLSRAVQVRLQPGSLASFQIVSDESITISATTRTDGKVYSNGDVNHRGTADGPLYAQGRVCDQGQDDALLLGIITSDPAQTCGGVSETSQFPNGGYDGHSLPPVADEIPGPIDFDKFEAARLAVKTAAQNGGLYINGSTASTGGLLEGLLGALGLTGYMATFQENPSGPGTITVYPIINLDIPLVSPLLNLLGLALPANLPLLGCPTTYAIPANGAVYFEQTVVVSTKLEASLLCGSKSLLGGQASVIDGEVTIAGGGDIQIGGDVRYAATGDNVLGLIAKDNIGISALAIGLSSVLANDLDFRGAAVAAGGQWRGGLPIGLAVPIVAPSGLLHADLTVTGMMGARDGFNLSQYQTTDLGYDTALDELPPPYFPTFDTGWTKGYWREVTPPA
jgi:hypothetical protein